MTKMRSITITLLNGAKNVKWSLYWHNSTSGGEGCNTRSKKFKAGVVDLYLILGCGSGHEFSSRSGVVAPLTSSWFRVGKMGSCKNKGR